ncbi:MAG TPA: HupE/UreJ family protein [Longimicrobiales bacterium]|nr:HupE/UreJ family protein [Longimicrobiales bacterium]
MHSTFAVYLYLGFDHIADLRGYDHILFIVALSAGYGLTHWRHLLVLVTAFTVGHSVTLALATLRLVSVSTAWVEFLIPVTILATGVFTLLETGTRPAHLPGGRSGPLRAQRVKYAMALLFGLVHGLGFSTYLRAVLGDEESLALPLFSFNVGLEVGQIAILACILALGWAVVRGTPLSPRWWTRLLAGGAALAAAALVVGRVP